MTTTLTAVIAGLREAADFLEKACPVIPNEHSFYPLTLAFDDYEMTDVHSDGGNERAQQLYKALGRLMFSELDEVVKDANDYALKLRAHLGAPTDDIDNQRGVRLEFSFARARTCERIEDGTEVKVLERPTPFQILARGWLAAQDAAIKEASKVPVEVPKFRTECPSVLG